MQRRFETIVDAARERSVQPPPPPPTAAAYVARALLFSILWWFWLYATAHIVIYVFVLGGPGLGFESTSAYVATYLVSFDAAVAVIALILALAGCITGWLPGSEPGLMHQGAPDGRRQSAQQIVRNVALGKLVTSVWAIVFVAPLQTYDAYGIAFAGTGAWSLIGAGFRTGRVQHRAVVCNRCAVVGYRHVWLFELSPWKRPGSAAEFCHGTFTGGLSGRERTHADLPVDVQSYQPLLRDLRSVCRNIRTLFNFEPPATEDEISAAALQFVRKLSGTSKPSQANQAAFDIAVSQITASATELLGSLVTNAPVRNREVEAAKARERSARRFDR